MEKKSVSSVNDLWQLYPMCLDDLDPLELNAEAFADRLGSLAPILFIDHGPFDLQVIESYEDNSLPIRVSCYDQCSVARYLQTESPSPARPKRTIISIAQSFSLDRLCVTKDCMLQLLTHFKVSPQFLNVLFKFGSQPQVFEESTGFTFVAHETDGSYTLCYQLMYIERNGRTPPKDPYSLRQIGVYHRHLADTNQDFFMLLHPMKDSVAQSRLQKMFEVQRSPREPAFFPLEIHLVILSSYLNNWQTYLEDLARVFKGLREKILAFDIGGEVQTNLSPDNLKELRNLEDKVSFRTSASLRRTLRTVQALKELLGTTCADDKSTSNSAKRVYRGLSTYIDQLDGNLASVEIMQKRIAATIGLLSNLLDLRNQATSDKINNHMLALTQETVDDNATVRVITVFTLMYLPASFVASLLGANLFVIEQPGRRFAISKQFWIFFCVAIPLTIITLSTWWVMKTQQDKNRTKRRRRGRLA